MASDKGGLCWKCGAALAAEDYRRGDVCRRCHYETRCCLNCEFYDPACNNQCREPAAEPAADKEKSNFCEFFRAIARAPKRPGPGGSAAPPSKDAAKTAFDALFKKKK